VSDGVEAAIARALAYAPYADLLWFETRSRISRKRRSSPRDPREYPGKMLAYNAPRRSTGAST